MGLVELVKEFCNTEEEIHAVGLGIDVGVMLALKAPVVLDEQWIPVSFPVATRADVIEEYQYYFTGIAVGYASADPTIRARAGALLRILTLVWRR